MKRFDLKKIIKEEIQNAVQKNNIIKSVISIDDAIKMKKSGKYDGADWYYYRGILTATSTPEHADTFIIIDNKTWLVPVEFVKTHNVRNATYPAFYKNNKPENLKEYIKSNNELDILINAAEDINTQYFKGRGQIDSNNYRMAVRDTVDNVIDILERGTKVIKKTKGFTAKEDEESEYYQLPEFNVSISLDSYKVSRATIIQFLSIDGEKPEVGNMLENTNSPSLEKEWYPFLDEFKKFIKLRIGEGSDMDRVKEGLLNRFYKYWNQYK